MRVYLQRVPARCGAHAEDDTRRGELRLAATALVAAQNANRGMGDAKKCKDNSKKGMDNANRGTDNANKGDG